MNNESLRIAVTGATGYIASWVVKKLLDRGHVVHGTVRNLNDQEKLAHILKQQVYHEGRLHLFKADLLKGGFEKAFKDCDIVIHMASPFLIGKIYDAQSQLVDPALRGTENVLNAVNATPSVNKVILTSSVVSLYNDAKEAKQKPNKTFTPADWNEGATPNYQPYNYSKTIAEKKAWDIHSQQNRWSLTTVCPGFVMGPSLSKDPTSASIQFARQMLTGEHKIGAPRLSYGFVDVRDAAETHVHAALQEHSEGRYITVNEVHSLLEVAEIMQDVTEHTEYPLPSRELPNWLVTLVAPTKGFSAKMMRRNLGYTFHFDTSKTKNELGVYYRKMDETFRDMINQMERDDIV